VFFSLIHHHIKQFGLRPSQLGGVFIIRLIGTLPSGILVGYLSDKSWAQPKSFLVFIGFVLMFLADLLLGPFPLLHLEPLVNKATID
jgi:hypothetical protein